MARLFTLSESKYYLMALDAGTGSIRAVIFDLEGNQIAVGQAEWRHLAVPDVPGSMEFDLNKNWQLACECMRQALHNAGIAPEYIAAVSACSMREGIVLYNNEGAPIWACANVDARAAREVSELKELHNNTFENEVYRATGQTLALSAIPRLLWLAHHRSDIYRQASTITMISDWLAYMLSGELAVVLLFVLPGFLDRQYLSVQTLTMVYSSAQILILLAMGATLVMLTRNIDVSVGSITGMCAVLLGMLLNAGYSLPVACVATLLLGLLAGFFNGVLVAWLKIPAIVATLGTLGLYRGIMLLWTGGKWIEGLPAELKQLSAPLLLGVSAIGWLTIILVAFMAWLLAKTAFGRSFYATGDNLQGARQLGVRTEAIRIVAFSLNGCMAALAGIVFASQIGFIPNQTGTGLEMKAIAACVLGGISLLGGSGAIIGAVLGAWFLTQIDSVLVLLRIPAWWNDFIAGLVLLAVLVFDGRLRCALERNLRRQKYARFMTPPPSVKPASSGKKREAA